MEDKKNSLFKRMTSWAGTGVGLLFQIVIVCVILVFWAGSCVKDGKNFLAGIGVYKPVPANEVQFRQFDLDNDKDARLISSLVKLAEAGGMDLDKIRVAIAVDPHINAMTIGTDTFVFCEGLDKLSDDALDAVMAHEVGHAIKNHGDRSSKLVNTVNTATRIAGAIAGADDETKAEVTSWAVDVAFAPYSRGQELEADSVAVELLKKAGYPLNAVEVMCAALDSISKQETDSGGGFLSTHPSIPERIAAIRKNSRNVSGPLTTDQYWPAMTTIIRATNPRYEQLQGLMEKVKSSGELAALDDIAEQGDKRVAAGEAFIQKLRDLVPPAEYEETHALMISFTKGLQTALEHQVEAAKKHDLNGALAAESEANDVMIRYEDFLNQSLPGSGG